jgi:ribonuclease HII
LASPSPGLEIPVAFEDGDTIDAVGARGRKWVDVPTDRAMQVHDYLLANGGLNRNLASVSEHWRVRFEDATFTYYATGTLFCTTSPSRSVHVAGIWAFIDAAVPLRFRRGNRPYTIGLDETGKSEVIGPLVLTAAVIPTAAAGDLETIVGLAETKTRHADKYWLDLRAELEALDGPGADFLIEKVPPDVIDGYNLNSILDVTYARIVRAVGDRLDPAQCRIVLDDYGVGDPLRRALHNAEEHGAEVIVEPRADDRYLETRVASVVAKAERVVDIRALNEIAEFHVKGRSVGTGSASSPDTKEWLLGWKATGKAWPPFVRRSYGPIVRLDGVSRLKKRRLS